MASALGFLTGKDRIGAGEAAVSPVLVPPDDEEFASALKVN